jgi:hypothetical protein
MRRDLIMVRARVGVRVRIGLIRVRVWFVEEGRGV